MFRTFLLTALTCGLVGATETFEKLASGALREGNTCYGTLSAQPGHAEINRGHGRNSAQALRVLGGTDRSVTLLLNKPVTLETPGQCWVERWTSRAPFCLRVLAVTPCRGAGNRQAGHARSRRLQTPSQMGSAPRYHRPYFQGRYRRGWRRVAG